MVITLMLDECISPSISPRLWEENVDNFHVRDRDLLGESDHSLWRLALAESRTFVTINAGDFRRLAESSTLHAGLITIPSGGTRDAQFGWIMDAVRFANGRNVFRPGFVNEIVGLDEQERIHVEDCYLAEIEELDRLSLN